MKLLFLKFVILIAFFLLQVAFEELQDLKGVWSELCKIWEQIDEMKEKPWLSVQPRKLRQQIDNLLAQMKETEEKLRT